MNTVLFNITEDEKLFVRIVEYSDAELPLEMTEEGRLVTEERMSVAGGNWLVLPERLLSAAANLELVDSISLE